MQKHSKIEKLLIVSIFCLFLFFNKLIAISENDILDKLNNFKNDRERIEYILSELDDFENNSTSESLKILETLEDLIHKNDYDEYLAELFLAYGVYWQIKADYINSTKYLTSALKEAEEHGDKHLIGRVSRQLGENYRATIDFDRAYIHLNRAKDIFTELQDSLYLARTYNRFAAILFEDNSNHSDNEALDYALLSNEIAKILKDTSLLVNNYNIIGACYNSMNDFDKGIFFLKKAVAITDSTNSIDYSGYLYNLAYIYHRKGEYRKSIEYALKAYNIAMERGYIYTLADISMVLAFSYDSLRDYKKAYFYKTQQLNCFDSIYKAGKRMVILEFEEKYESKKKEQIIQNQDIQQQYQIILFIIVILSFAIIIFIYYRKQKQLTKANSELTELNKKISDQNKELKILNQTKDKFFSIIAHDLKNPIAGIKNLSELIVDEYKNLEDDEKYEFMKEIKDSSSHLFSLLDDLLVWSRSQSGKITFSPESMDLCYIIKTNIDLLRMSARRKNISLESVGKCPCYGFFDNSMLTTVIRNLISNAIKFTNDGGKILVSHDEDDYNIFISVEDNGIGMSDQIRRRLFRIDETITTLGTNDERGTGLGLVVCKEFVEKHNGTIKVDSREGEGSSFTISIPK